MNIKKALPFIAVIVVAIIVVGAIFIVKKINQPVANQNTDQTDDSSVPDLPNDEKPATGLVPKPDGHYLTLKLTGIKVPNANSMDYEITWKANNTGTETTQGTSGTVKLDGSGNFSRDLLLGSESSGKFRYDKGVENGTLTLRFRDSNGKLLGKLATNWHLQSNTTTLTSVDGSFKYTLTKAADGVFFITMQSFGTPNAKDVVVFSNGWAIFASDGLPHVGSVN